MKAKINALTGSVDAPGRTRTATQNSMSRLIEPKIDKRLSLHLQLGNRANFRLSSWSVFLRSDALKDVFDGLD